MHIQNSNTNQISKSYKACKSKFYTNYGTEILFKTIFKSNFDLKHLPNQKLIYFNVTQKLNQVTENYITLQKTD